MTVHIWQMSNAYLIPLIGSVLDQVVHNCEYFGGHSSWTHMIVENIIVRLIDDSEQEFSTSI